MTTANSFRVDRYSVFGADLDLTLLDTRRATAAALHLMNLRCGERVDIEAFVARLGPPVRQELARWIPEDRLDEAVHVFRTSFVESGVSQITLMPGAADLAAQLRRRGVVSSSSRHASSRSQKSAWLPPGLSRTRSSAA
jgi:phosphoglycolate phosphatase